MSRGLLFNKKSPIFNHSDLKKTIYSSYTIFICIFILFPSAASSDFFSFKFLKNIHLELIEYFSIFCLITRNYVSKYFGKKCVLVAQACPTLCDPMDCVAHQVSLSMEFSRQEYWSGLPFPSPEELPNPGIELWSPASQADSLPSELMSPSLGDHSMAPDTLRHTPAACFLLGSPGMI